MLDSIRLQQLLSPFSQLKIALLGDLFLDRYLEIPHDRFELSIETGLEAYQVTRVRNVPGALGTLLNNLTALGVGRLLPVTVIGDDGQGYDLIQALQTMPAVDRTFVLRDPERLTPTYTKPLRQTETGSWTELNRLDLRTREPLTLDMRRQVIQALREAFARADGLIVLDQVHEAQCGVVHDDVRAALVELAEEAPQKPILVDSRNHLHLFSAAILKGNRSEIMTAAERLGTIRMQTTEVPREDHPAAVVRPAGETPTASDATQPHLPTLVPSLLMTEPATLAAAYLARHTARPVFCTLGERGVLVAHPTGELQHAKGIAVAGPIDIVGAGDSATSAIMASLLSGATYQEAAELANLVASITIQQLGTTGTATPAQILARHNPTQPT